MRTYGPARDQWPFQKNGHSKWPFQTDFFPEPFQEAFPEASPSAQTKPPERIALAEEGGAPGPNREGCCPPAHLRRVSADPSWPSSFWTASLGRRLIS